MYKQVETQQNIELAGINEGISPLATLKDEYGGTCHIIEDDHCLMLCIEKDDGKCVPATHLFREAIEVIKTLEIPV